MEYVSGKLVIGNRKDVNDKILHVIDNEILLFFLLPLSDLFFFSASCLTFYFIDIVQVE